MYRTAFEHRREVEVLPRPGRGPVEVLQNDLGEGLGLFDVGPPENMASKHPVICSSACFRKGGSLVSCRMLQVLTFEESKCFDVFCNRWASIYLHSLKYSMIS